MSNIFYMPTTSFIGEGAVNNALDEVGTMGFKKALIVTDETLSKMKLTDRITTKLTELSIEYVIFDKTKPNPTIRNVNDGIKMYQENNCDFLISLGGGSPHDCAKAVSLVISNGGEITDYEGIDKSSNQGVPLVAVNTTAGTASEITRFTIITDEKRKIKMAIIDKHLIPIIAVNDPTLMTGMPKSLTAATGMDALTHAIEAYVSQNANPLTDTCAEKAIKIIFETLEKAVLNGQDMQARTNMAYAQYLAGMAFNNSGLGYVHAIAHQLGGIYDLPHGVCNALLLAHVMDFNLQHVTKKFAKINKIINGENENLTEEEAAENLIISVRRLTNSVGIPKTLSMLGVKEADFPKLAENALKDVCGFTSPVKATKEDIIKILKSAF